MRSIVEGARLDPDAEATCDGAPLPIDKTSNFRVLTIAPLKSRARCDEKVEKEYGGEYDRVIDCVRCSIVVDTEEQLLIIASALRDGGADVSVLGDGGGGGGAPGGGGAMARFVVVRLKNRYTKPLFNGYRDGLYNIALEVLPGSWMVCEVQLHLAAILVFKEESHHFYAYFVRRAVRASPDAGARVRDVL